MKKSRLLMGAVVSILMCLCLMGGATFALFTDKAEVNVAITAGKVDVEAKITDFTTYSRDVEQAKGTFENGGVAVLNGNTLTIDRMTPMDKIVVGLEFLNYSNVSIKYATSVNDITVLEDGEVALFDALTFSIEDENGNLVNAFDDSHYTPWTKLNPIKNADGEVIDTFNLVIEFPNGTPEHDNQYQGAKCDIRFTIEAVQSNADVPVVAKSKTALLEALKSGEDIVLANNIDVGGVISLKPGVVLDGNGYTLSNAKLYMGNESAVKNTVFEGSEGATDSYIYAHDVSVVIDGCTFDSANWDAIQYTTKVDNVSVEITNCKFFNTEDQAYRYVHVEIVDALRDKGTNNVKVTLTNNAFENIDTCEDDGITVAGVLASNVTVANNVATAATKLAAESECWFGEYNGAWIKYDVDVFEVYATVETAQSMVEGAQAGDVITLLPGEYDVITVKNTDGSAKNGITIVGTDGVVVGAIKLNASHNVTVKNVEFDAAKAVANGTYYSNITFNNFEFGGIKNSASDIVIDGCKFNGVAANSSAYIPMYTHDQGCKTNTLENLDVINCEFNADAVSFIRLYYTTMPDSVVTVKGCKFGSFEHYAISLSSSNAADLVVEGNTFNYSDRQLGQFVHSQSPASGAKINVKVTGNTFHSDIAGSASEASFVAFGSKWNTSNLTCDFSGNTFTGEFAGLTEATANTVIPA